MERLDQDEDAKLLSEGKKNVGYREVHRADAQSSMLLSWKQSAQDERQKPIALHLSWQVLDNQIRSVCTGLHKGAVEDALLACKTNL
jgi:hypothetical protein